MQKAFCLFLLTSAFLAISSAQPQANSATSPLSGRWIFTGDFLGTPTDDSAELIQDGNKITGNFDGDKLEGTITGNSIHFLAKDDQGGSEEVTGTVQGDTISGTAVFIDSINPAHPTTIPFTAKRAAPRPSAAPQHHEFVPTVFYRQFSPHNKPLLSVNPGDTIHTTTVDAGGIDEKDVTRVQGGNPETGPFYVESAVPGDTLVVHFTKIRLNRDWAQSDDYVVGRAVDNELAVKLKDNGKNIRWHLDTVRGVATPEKPGEHLVNYSVPLEPMLGCVAVAVPLSSASPGTGDFGRFGGNMDFNEIIEGATVYLPVKVTGAFFYLGDGHAAQGDGELNGNALETSMDVEFTVDVISAKCVPGPRVESSSHVMIVRLAGSLEEAMREATSNMADWLTNDYRLTPPNWPRFSAPPPNTKSAKWPTAMLASC